MHHRLITAALLAAAILAPSSAFAQTLPDNIKIIKGPDGVVRIEGGAESKTEELPKLDEEKKDEAKPDDAKEEKKDPNDITGGIGDSQKVRNRQTTTKPAKKGLWEQLVDQPWYSPTKRAQQNLFHGQYVKAETQYKDLLKETPASQEFIEGLAESILRQGREADLKRFDENIAALTAEQRSTPRMTRLRAEALMFSGKYAEAQDLLKTFADAHPKLTPIDAEVLATLNTYGKLLEAQAQFGPAIGIYMKLVKAIDAQMPDDPRAATELAYALYRGSVLGGVGREKYQTVLAELHRVENNDQTYWPAKLVIAEVMLGAHNEKDGGAAIDEVLSLNPNELRARFLFVDHGIAAYNFEAARAQLEELKKRTDLALVDAYEGRLLLKERLPQQAVAPLLSAVKKNPNLAEARGWLAAAYYLLVDETRMRAQLEAIKAPNDTGLHPVALFEAGEILRDARQFTEAENLYTKADQVAKWWSDPPCSLGQLYLETGHEEKAKVQFEKSFKIDPYNVRSLNQLKLLEHLQAFETLESKTRLGPGSGLPAFIVRYEKQDEILAALALEWMEKIRPEIWSYFKVESLPAPTQIEFFPSHEQFGVRTTGLPWIGTVGASTGNVIAMDVPRGGAKGMMGAFDWARVLRHEYTHTVTLAMTNNRIPHWLTEAAACEQEEAPRDWENCQLLASNFRAGELFKIANLNWGFIRPKKSTDRHLAYMQSQWLYQYLVANYGLPKMIDFMQAFHNGATEADAWKKVYGKSMEDMDTEFLAWAEKQIESWGLPTDKLPKQKDLQDALKKNPKDVKTLVELAWLEAGGGKLKEAKTHLDTALQEDPQNIRARELMGAVLAQSKGKDSTQDLIKAKVMLQEVVSDDPKRPVTVRTLGVLAMQRKDYDDAEKWFKQLQLLRPLDSAAYNNLAGIYLLKKDTANAIAQLLELQRHEQHDERIPRRLATLMQQQGQLQGAEQCAYKAIRINPYNAINHEIMAQVLMAENQPQRAIEFWSAATLLQPRVAEFWEGLAESKGQSNDAPGAAEAAQKALDLQPNSPAKKWLK